MGKRLLAAEDTVLLVVDIQEQLIPVIANHKQVLKNSATLIQGAQVIGLPIIVTEQYPKGLGPTVPILKGMLTDIPILEKIAFSCTGCPDFISALQKIGRKQILICGIETHVCVLQTAMELPGSSYTPHVACDATGSRSPEHRGNALSRMECAGVTVTNTESALFELLREAGTDKFKAISRLVR